MMSGHGANPIFFNKDRTYRTLTNPPPPPAPNTHTHTHTHTHKNTRTLPTSDYVNHPLYAYFFPRVNFCSSNVNKDDLKAR